MYSRFLGLFFLSTTVFFSTTSNSQDANQQAVTRDKDEHGIVSFSIENDAVSDQDAHYTNGFRVSYLSPESAVPNWLENTANLLPIFNSSGNKRWGFAFGQNMYTPENVTISPPNPNEQPYAGWLYGTALLVSDNDRTLDTFQLTLGVVGPSSLAHETQDTVHSLLGFQQYQGWDYQLKDEPGVVISYDRKFRNLYSIKPFNRLDFDLTPSAGASIGNVDTSANIGLMARLGRDLPSDYGPPLIKPSLSGSDFFRPEKKFGWYLFGGIEGRAVARDIFLDGNTFRDSPSVDKEILVGGLQAGIAFTYKDVRISYTQVSRTKQYSTQNNNEEYGAITLSYRLN